MLGVYRYFLDHGASGSWRVSSTCLLAASSGYRFLPTGQSGLSQNGPARPATVGPMEGKPVSRPRSRWQPSLASVGSRLATERELLRDNFRVANHAATAWPPDYEEAVVSNFRLASL